MKDLEQQLEAINAKDLDEKRTWYSSVAEIYNWTRPPYPQALISRVIELAQLPPEAFLLEIGCGPGTATVDFAQRGFSMVCLEPSPEAGQLARHNCAPYPVVEIVNTTFEEWPLADERFDAVLAANSFHWISAEIGFAKAAAALNKKGYLILLWNTPPQPSYDVYQELAEIYQTQAPSLRGYESIKNHQENLGRIGQQAIDSGLFQDLRSEQMICELTYSIEDYLGLLSTLSPYIALETQQRQALFASLKKALEDTSEQVQLSYLSVFHIVQKVS